MKKIPLTRGKIAVIDDCKFEILSQFSWVAAKCDEGLWYAKNNLNQYMHRLLMDAKTGEIVDHVNFDSLDNRMENLRIVTRQQNAWHQRPQLKTTKSSRFKGVHWDPERHRWIAQIAINRKRRFIGRFALESDAAEAYNRAASELFGKFAYLNPVPKKIALAAQKMLTEAKVMG